MKYRNRNKPQEEMTANPSKYPQGKFKEKPCKNCQEPFKPQAPSHMYCSTTCANHGIVDAYLVRTYGITYKDYLGMLEAQEEKCALCGNEGFVMDKEKHKLKLVVDHCHTTGKVRGLLCHNCNRGLGLFKDNLTTLNKAMEYLKVQRLS